MVYKFRCYCSNEDIIFDDVVCYSLKRSSTPYDRNYKYKKVGTMVFYIRELGSGKDE